LVGQRKDPVHQITSQKLVKVQVSLDSADAFIDVSAVRLSVSTAPYFTTNVKKLFNVCVCPFNVVVNDKLYVPAGVAPFGPVGKLLHAADPNATSNNVANVNATRRFRRNVHTAPPNISEHSSNPIPPAGGTNPVDVVAPWQNV
jgi:hypothetical protein